MDITDLTPVLCSLLVSIREEGGEGGGNPDGPEGLPSNALPGGEVESLRRRLLRLEELDERFDGLSIVAETRRLIAEALSGQGDLLPRLSRGPHALRKGLEPLRQSILTAVAASVAGASDQDLLAAVNFKKKRAGNWVVSLGVCHTVDCVLCIV
jgi:hypothetical protein